MESATYTNLNRLISQVVSSVTASFRFEGSIPVDPTEFWCTLTPYPGIHFPLTAYSRIVQIERAYYERFITVELTRSVYNPLHQIVKCNPKSGKYSIWATFHYFSFIEKVYRPYTKLKLSILWFSIWILFLSLYSAVSWWRQRKWMHAII